MLVVAAFSLSTMVQAYAAAAPATTPRVAELPRRDRAAQAALATFSGAFLFALVGILALGVRRQRVRLPADTERLAALAHAEDGRG